MSDALPEAFGKPAMRRRIGLIAESHARLTGRKLVPDGGDAVVAMWAAPRVILAHGTEADPVLFFGNRAGLALFECSVAELTAMPSRLTAEPLAREERQMLLDRVRGNGFIDDYAGVRVSTQGRRFRIEQATVWNLVDARGEVHGQAATFERWVELGLAPGSNRHAGASTGSG